MIGAKEMEKELKLQKESKRHKEKLLHKTMSKIKTEVAKTGTAMEDSDNDSTNDKRKIKPAL